MVNLNKTPRLVLKRDGKTTQDFDDDKLIKAVTAAWKQVEPVDEVALTKVLAQAKKMLPDDEVAGVEAIQDAIELALMKVGKGAVAKAFILYRMQRAELRQQRKAADPTAISDYIHFAKYGKYLPKAGRREVYAETVARTERMHLNKFADNAEFCTALRWAFDHVRDKKVLPSMRSMQFGGIAIERNSNRIYNCSASPVNRLEVFAETMFLLLSGTGTGYSVQIDHVEQLPKFGFIDRKRVVHHQVADTIEGWADAVRALLESYLDGTLIEFSYAKVRPEGSLLKVSGGRAPGHLRLKSSLENIRTIMDSVQGSKLRPIQAHDIMCHLADAVLSGGIRRSAMISLFSLEDSEMLYAKTGTWYKTAPWRANANNSVVLKRDEVKKKAFKRVFNMIKEFGEPGFLFVEDYDYLTNPCSEIGLNARVIVDETVRAWLNSRGLQRVGERLTDGQKLYGWAFCNLCEINGAKLTSLQDFLDAAKAATIIGTAQASYTSMPYLGWISEFIAEREALLGIGMTGMMDSPAIACNAKFQRKVAAEIVKWNTEYAAMIGINPAARTTCIKPSGTTSLELGAVASGHHPHHARRYIRRVTANETETLFQEFKKINPTMCVRKPNGDWVIEFPVEAPANAIVKGDIGAIEFLDMVKSTQQNWVVPGTGATEISPGLYHNVSNTVTVKSDEWNDVAEYIWANRELFTGISLLPSTGDKDYAFAPNEEIVTEDDERRWNQLISTYKPVDYLTLFEADDETALSAEAACAGGQCEIVFSK